MVSLQLDFKLVTNHWVWSGDFVVNINPLIMFNCWIHPELDAMDIHAYLVHEDSLGSVDHNLHSVDDLSVEGRCIEVNSEIEPHMLGVHHIDITIGTVIFSISERFNMCNQETCKKKN